MLVVYLAKRVFAEQMTSLQDGAAALNKEISDLKALNIELKKEKVRRDSFIKDLKEELMKKSQQVTSLEQQVKQVSDVTGAAGQTG